MKTMIWKELRENIKWAALAFLGLLLAEIYILSSEQKSFQADSGYGFTLCSPAFLMVTSFGCSVIGAALGIVQILPELRRDQWAALLHRPVSRSVIFFGKVFAGLLFCFCTTILPLLASACFVAMPAKFPAPFVPGMMLPSLSDLLLGPVFYFAALLACLQQGRWFGLKGLIVLSVVPVFWLHTNAGNAFMVLPLVAAGVLMLAAWGAMLGNGPVKDMPLPGRLALLLVALAGAQTGLLLLAVCAGSLAGNKFNWAADYRGFEVTLDGQVFQTRERADGSGSLVTDMAGKEITDERYLGNNSYDYFCNFGYLGFDLKNDAFIEKYVWGRFPRNIGNYVKSIRVNSYDAPEIWYLPVHENYLVGYDKLSRRTVGLFDREGFKPPGSKPAPFPAPLRYSMFSNYDPILMIAGSRVFAFDFADRRMTSFFEAPRGPVLESATFSSKFGVPAKIAIALENEIRVFDSAGKPIVVIPYPHDPGQWRSIMIATNKASDRIYLQSQAAFWWNNSNRVALPDYLDEFDLHGNLLHSYSLPASTYVAVPPGWVDRVIDYSLPLGPALAGWLWSRHDPYSILPDSSLQVISSFQPIHPWALLLAALLFALVAFLWARRTGISMGAAVGWSAFVFVFGLAGLLAFRLVAGWPVRVRCPSCGQKRAIENERCGGCDQAWELPQRNGTEILDASVLQQP